MAFIHSKENPSGLFHVKFRLVLFTIVSKVHYIGVAWLLVCEGWVQWGEIHHK